MDLDRLHSFLEMLRIDEAPMGLDYTVALALFQDMPDRFEDFFLTFS